MINRVYYAVNSKLYKAIFSQILFVFSYLSTPSYVMIRLAAFWSQSSIVLIARVSLKTLLNTLHFFLLLHSSSIVSIVFKQPLMSRADGMTHFLMDDEVQGKMERAEEGKGEG